MAQNKALVISFQMICGKKSQSGICPAPCATRGKQIFVIGSRKKFGGGGESECGMTLSNQKKMKLSQISQRKCLSVAKLSAAFSLFHAAAYLWTSASSSTIFSTNQRPGNR